MTVAFNYQGVQFTRAYEWRFCELPGCGKRIQFRIAANGKPEGADKHNKRATCCLDHARKLHALRVSETQQQRFAKNKLERPVVSRPTGIEWSWLMGVM